MEIVFAYNLVVLFLSSFFYMCYIVFKIDKLLRYELYDIVWEDHSWVGQMQKYLNIQSVINLFNGYLTWKYYDRHLMFLAYDGIGDGSELWNYEDLSIFFKQSVFKNQRNNLFC